jgi:hypothetical protein
MKINLERKLPPCPDKLYCTVCGQLHEVGRIRALLYNDQGLIQGDLCSRCLKLKPDVFKHKLREKASVLLQQPKLFKSSRISYQERDLELREVAEENIKFPNSFNWLLKHIEVFAQESQELEAARFARTTCYCGRKSRHRIFFEESDFHPH